MYSDVISMRRAALRIASTAVSSCVVMIVVPTTSCSPSTDTQSPSSLLGGSSSLRGIEALRQWNSGSSTAQLNRIDPTTPSSDRRVVCVLGITGAGKSSTANTLAGRTQKQFLLSGALTSVTQAVSFRDYDFLDSKWRVVDTPGLCDTNKNKSDIKEELMRLARFAPHGVTAFIVVVPRGRFTPEQENALRELSALFDDQEMKKYSLVAITNATDATNDSRTLLTRDALIDEINSLPLRHFFRQFVEAVGSRVVAVENRLDPHRQISRMTMHQRILDVEDGNKGRRYDTRRFLLGEEAAAAAAAEEENEGGAGGGGDEDHHQKHNTKKKAQRLVPKKVEDVLRESLRLGPCTPTITRRERDGRLVMNLECEIRE